MSDAPAPHELELSVFGPGLGECIVMHLGSGDWIVVDSCRDRKSARPIALEYLDKIGIDVATQVKLICATHWHDDHILGLADVLRECKSAKFVTSGAYDLQAVARAAALGKANPVSSVATEYGQIMDILRERQKRGERPEAVGPIKAVANRTLFKLGGDNRELPVEIHWLSPSDGVLNIAEAELSQVLSAVQNHRRPTKQGPNRLSVVLWVEVGSVAVLLGGDLEHVAGGITEGWQAIVDTAERPQGNARFFKVSHHGSQNAHHPGCWANLLTPEPIAILTPHSRARLPRRTDIQRICGHATQTYLTSNPMKYGLPRRDNAVEKTLREITLDRRALIGPMGHVRIRTDARSPELIVQVILNGGASRECTAS